MQRATMRHLHLLSSILYRLRPVWLKSRYSIKPIKNYESLIPACYNRCMSALRSPVVISPTLIGREAQFNVLTDLLAQASSV